MVAQRQLLHGVMVERTAWDIATRFFYPIT